MKTVQQILGSKSQRIITIGAGGSVLEALKLMMENNISALLVNNETDLVGIFTERDYARKIVLQGKSSANTKVNEVMTAQPITVCQADSIAVCMQLMTERHIRHLPVVEKGEILGIISIGDLVKFIIEDQQQTISQLEGYINS